MSKPLLIITNKERRLYCSAYENFLAAALTGALAAEMNGDYAFDNVQDRVAFANANASEALRVFINGIQEEEPR